MPRRKHWQKKNASPRRTGCQLPKEIVAMKRRTFIKMAAGTAAVALHASPVFAQSSTKVKVGYLHTLAVDGQIWLAEDMGIWKKNGLQMEFIQFQSEEHTSELQSRE